MLRQAGDLKPEDFHSKTGQAMVKEDKHLEWGMDRGEEPDCSFYDK